MKTPFFSPPARLLIEALITLLVGLGCAYPLLLTLDIAAPLQLCALCAAGAAAVFALLDCMPRLRFLSYPLLLAAICLILFPYRDQADAVSAAVTLLLSGNSLAFSAYARAVTALTTLLLTGVGASLARSEQAFFPLALLTISVLLAVSFLGASVSALSFLPLILALLLAARAPAVSGNRALPCAALVLGLTLLLLPLSSATVPALERFAEDVRQRIDDYLFFTEPRTAFSLSTTGWQPLGAERLGGPVAPEDSPVMQVRTSGRTLLRATVKNEYTGLAWADTTSGRRYLYVSPRFMSLRRDLFDQKRPAGEALDILPENETIEVVLNADAASTLYLTQRFLSPRGDGVVAYYSPSSEVFATRSLAPGDQYAFSGRRMSASTYGIRSAVLAASAGDDPYAQTVRGTYLQLPPSVEERAYTLARTITEGAENDFDRAAALCTYLQRAFRYTLDQSEPPVTQDFVCWFLFEEQQGYCTSFASTMTVLCRTLGIPARYVEGYAAEPDSDGIARVTQQDAHAWTEVYFPGFGWLTFDPTPGAGSSPDGTSGDSHHPDAPDAPDPSAGADDPGASPSPSPTATPEITPTPSPTPEHHDPGITPTPEITPAPVPTQTPPPDRPDEPDSPSAWLFLLLTLLVLLALTALRLWFVSPAHLADRLRDPADQLLIWYRATEEALRQLGVCPWPGEPPATFMLRAQETLGRGIPLLPLGKLVCVARYSAKRLKPAAVQRGEKTYRAVLSLLSPVQRYKMLSRRLIRGLKLS